MSKITLLLLFCLPLPGQSADRVRHVFGADEPLTTADSRPPREIAQAYLRTFAQGVSLSLADVAAAYLVKEYRTSHNGVTHLIFRQRFQGVDIVNAEWVVNIDRDGRVLNAGGDLYAAPAHVELPPAASSRAAVRAALKAVNPKLAQGFAALESHRAPRKSNGVRYEGGALPEDVEGALVWHVSEGLLRPAWAFSVLDANGVDRYAAVIEDGTQALLEMRPLTFYQSAPHESPPHGLVFEKESPQPNPTPGVRLTAVPPLVPQTAQPFQGDPVASPRGWVAAAETAGNNVVAGENLLGTSFLLTPRTAKAASGDFSFPLLLGPDMPNPLNYGDAATVNLFYWMNRAHDLHYLSGFDEAAGNFQLDNFGRGGVGNDPIYAYSHYGAQALSAGLVLNSSFSSRGADDGSESTVRMYLSAGVGSAGDFFTDGSYDAQVMVHEYTHGVSTRLVRQGYSTFQGASMGEAWSDFFGLEYTLPEGAPPDGIYPLGQYFDQSFGFGAGRTRGYSTNLELNPLSYANLGHVISAPEVHADGEIWVEALWEARANLIQQFGEKEGRRRVRLLVLDGMKLSPPAPSMVDMRDAILLADRVDFKGASQDQLWAGFAKRGLGALAYSSSGDTAHVISSFELPSTTGSMRFYDNPIVLGEQIRVVLQDSNYTQPTVRIQLTSGAGDLEDLILHRVGSIYTGAISSSATTLVAAFDGILSLTPGDQVTAYYVDADAGGAARLISTAIDTMPPYFFSTSNPAFTFPNERALNIGTSLRITLPFEFPFFAKKYTSALVYRNGLIAFEVPISTACTDATALNRWNAIAPLWMNLSTTGSAQPMENVYTSSTADSITFRWAAETVPQFLGVAGSPVNFAATLFADGRIEFHYGAGNTNLASSVTASGCSPSPTLGVSNGHGVFAQTVGLASLTSAVTVHADPPFNFSSVPVGSLESPAPDQRFQDILQVTGVAHDSAAFVSRVDVFIDGVQRTRLSATTPRPDFCSSQTVRGCPNVGFSAPLNLVSMGLAPGAHTLFARVTNSRGASFDFPDSPVNFFMDPGQSRLPFGTIDNHADGDIVSGVVTIQGYVADADLRILSVDTLIDGVTYGPTTYGFPQADVCANLTAKPPNCPNAGFLLRVNTLEGFPPVPDGLHTLQIRARDETGRLTLLPETLMHLNVANGAAVPITGVLTSPKSNDHLTGSVQISGYAYSEARRILSATLLVDGSCYGAIPYGSALPDVCAQLSEVAACPRIGFAVNFDTARVSNGPHVLGVLLRNDRGDSITIPQVDNGGINVFVDNR